MRPSRGFRWGREALAEVREWLGGPSGAPGWVGTFSLMSRRTLQGSGRGREALPEIQEGLRRPSGGRGVLLEVWEGSGLPLGSPGGLRCGSEGVGRLFWRSRRDRVAL